MKTAKEKTWQPRAKRCSECNQLEPIKDKKTGYQDQEKKFCVKWEWEIMNDLAAKQAVCRIEKPRKRRSRRKAH